MRGIGYVSEARVYFDSFSLESLAAGSASRNFELGVTGYLYFEKDRFVQYIEGDDDVVSALFETIRGDYRHQIVQETVEENLPARRFPGWQMRRLVRRELSSVHSDHVLSDHLLCLEPANLSSAPRNSDWEGLLWGMINRVSDVREPLGPY